MAKGRTNREICETLYIAEGTTKAHVATILETLDVANRTEAAAVMRDLGLDTAPPRAPEPAPEAGFSPRSRSSGARPSIGRSATAGRSVISATPRACATSPSCCATPDANVTRSRWPSRAARTRPRRRAARPTTSGCTLTTRARSPTRWSRRARSASSVRRGARAPERDPLRQDGPRPPRREQSGPGEPPAPHDQDRDVLLLHARAGRAHPLDLLERTRPRRAGARRGRRCGQTVAVRAGTAGTRASTCRSD